MPHTHKRTECCFRLFISGGATSRLQEFIETLHIPETFNNARTCNAFPASEAILKELTFLNKFCSTTRFIMAVIFTTVSQQIYGYYHRGEILPRFSSDRLEKPPFIFPTKCQITVTKQARHTGISTGILSSFYTKILQY